MEKESRNKNGLFTGYCRSCLRLRRTAYKVAVRVRASNKALLSFDDPCTAGGINPSEKLHHVYHECLTIHGRRREIFKGVKGTDQSLA
jgi:hypothetical protein